MYNTDGITPNVNPLNDPFLEGYSAEHSIATRNLIQDNNPFTTKFCPWCHFLTSLHTRPCRDELDGANFMDALIQSTRPD